MKLARLLSTLVLTVALANASPAHAQRGTQLAPDDVTVMVNKRLGAQQWVIVADLEFATVIGNVFNVDGSDPVFLFCTMDSPSVSRLDDFFGATVEITCSVAQGCTAVPGCGGASWQDVGTREIPGSFFLPPDAHIDPTPFSTPSQTATPNRTATTTPSANHNPACGSSLCDFNWCGFSTENQCPAAFNGDGSCDCGCQFQDTDCFSVPHPTSTPSGGGGGCCKVCTTGKPCGNSCISFSFTCHQPPGCAC